MTDISPVPAPNSVTAAEVAELGVIVRTPKGRRILAGCLVGVGLVLAIVTNIYGVAHLPQWLSVANSVYNQVATVSSGVWLANIK